MSRRRGRNQSEIEWNFFSFPVYFAFFAGMLVAVLLYPVILIVFVVSLFGTSFGVAHIISHWFRRRSINRRRQQEEEQERERRALARREAAAAANEEPSPRPRRRRRRRGSGPNT